MARRGIWICAILALVLVIGGFYSAYIGFSNPRTNPIDRLGDLGNFGSYLQGTTASLWSLAGLLIIFIAFLAQKQQLMLQQEQFERQSFENAFFELLTLHNEIASSMSDEDSSGFANARQFRGRDCFQRWYRSFREDPWHMDFHTEGTGEAERIIPEIVARTVSERYLKFYDSHQGDLGHYFRNLYHIIKFVKGSPVSDKRRYTSLVRAQLSQFELGLLFYNGLTAIPPESTNKFKPLIEEFGLLKNLNRQLLLNPGDIELYAPEAFR